MVATLSRNRAKNMQKKKDVGYIEQQGTQGFIAQHLQFG